MIFPGLPVLHARSEHSRRLGLAGTWPCRCFAWDNVSQAVAERGSPKPRHYDGGEQAGDRPSQLRCSGPNPLSMRMTQVDVSRLSYAELVALRKQLDHQIDEKRGEELKVLVDGFAKKLDAAGFSVAEGVEALSPYLATSGKRGRQAGSEAPVLYRDPANPSNTWSGRGRAAKWLADYEAQGRSRQEFKV